MGYAVADPQVVTALRKVHVPFSVTSLSQRIAIVCLAADDELLTRTDTRRRRTNPGDRPVA